MKRRKMLWAWFVCAMFHTQAQTIIPLSFQEDMLQARVKQLDEFCLRFNSHIDSAQAGFYAEARNIISLFDGLSIWNEQGVRIASEDQLQNIMNFCSSVSSSSVYLDFADTNWFAQLECDALYQGKLQKLTLMLRPRPIGQHEYCWRICGAAADFLNLTPELPDVPMNISPIDNELRFLSLTDLTHGGNTKNIMKLADTTLTMNPLNTLVALIHAGALSIEHTRAVTYHFFQVPGYYFTVDYFVRASYNAGWLISGLYLLPEEQKRNYISNHLLHLK